jgi:uncharacterized membrane protein YdjX (TVP38/TMEM64 family)
MREMGKFIETLIVRFVGSSAENRDIGGEVFVGVLVVALVCYGVWFFWTRRTKRRERK